MLKTFKKYINSVKNSGEHTKMMHAIVVASICTGIFAGFYLYLVRGVTPPTPDISLQNNTSYEARD
jgi:hypothetical protein